MYILKTPYKTRDAEGRHAKDDRQRESQMGKASQLRIELYRRKAGEGSLRLCGLFE